MVWFGGKEGVCRFDASDPSASLGMTLRVRRTSAIPPLTHPPTPLTVEHMFDADPQTETTPLADFIRDKTDDGRLIVRFLMDVMQGKIDDVTPCDREEARQLLNSIFNGAYSIPLPGPPEQ